MGVDKITLDKMLLSPDDDTIYMESTRHLLFVVRKQIKYIYGPYLTCAWLLYAVGNITDSILNRAIFYSLEIKLIKRPPKSVTSEL